MTRTSAHRLPRAACAALGLVGTAGLVLAVMLVSSDRLEAAQADLPPAAACCMGPLTLGDSLINSSEGGDKDFFESSSGPSSVMFLLGNNEGMQDFLTPLPYVNANTQYTCADSGLVEAMNWFDPASTDPAVNGATPYDVDTDLGGGDDFFNPELFYEVYGTRMVRGSSLANDFQSTVGKSVATLCGSLGYANDSNVKACTACLTTGNGAGKGKFWFRAEKTTVSGVATHRWFVSGRILNLRPPKFVVARKALKDTVDSLGKLRMGLATLDLNGDGAYDPAQVWTNPDNGVFGLSPTCSESFPAMSDAVMAATRSGMKKNINRVQFTGIERSFGEALTALGGYYSQKSQWKSWFDNLSAPNRYPGGSNWPAGSVSTKEWTDNANGGAPWEQTGNPSTCWGCQASAVIILADGTPQADNTVPVSKMLQLMVAQGAQHPDGTAVTFAANSSTPGGINYCNLFGVTKAYCDAAVDSIHGPDATNMNFMDDVTYFLAHADLRSDYTGPQHVRTYTIGFGDSAPMLRSMALAGGGRFFRADDATSLKDSIVSAVDDLKSGATSFASASVSNVQAGGMQTSVYIPRFQPRVGRPFEGHLYRYRYYSEFTEGCNATLAASDEGDPADLNADGDCGDVYFLDKPASWALTAGSLPPLSAFSATNIVQENKQGDWVKVSTATVDSDGKLSGGSPAVPFWDAATSLQSKSASDSCASGGRCIFTLVDRDLDTKLTAADNPPLEFSLANASTLEPYLLAAGDAFCAPMMAKLMPPVAYDGTDAHKALCAEAVIKFVRGVDIFDYDSDGNVTEDRPCRGDATKSCKLGDIFHSSPVVVDPPVNPMVCTLGLHAQCVMTLYSSTSDFAPVGEPICATASPKPCYAATPMDPASNPGLGTYGAYGEYLEANKDRDRFVLVGANDGMLHAFLAGKAISGEEFHTLGDDIFDLGTGEEMWAFIPPDLLAKLGRATEKHEYYVDGTPMVRDVWVDGSGSSASKDGIKKADEFHTVAIISERGGGQRYLALDVTDPWSVKKAAAGDSSAKPFLWMYPDACDGEAYKFGQSWMNFSPKPPSIGPVRIANSARTRGWDELWVTFLNGGYSNDLSRGGGVYMVDLWTGENVWSFVSEDSGESGTYAGVRDMLMPVAAAPAMLDVGAVGSSKADQDGYFDTAIVGDVGGQVWTFRFYVPGTRTNGAPVSNWFGARALELDRRDGEKGTDRNIGQKTPFFSIASNTLQTETGWLRTYLGTGDKQNLRDTEAMACGVDNLLACTRIGCKVAITLKTKVNGFAVEESLNYDHYSLKKNKTKTSGSMSQSCSGATMEISHLDIHCNKGHGLNGENFELTDKSTSMDCDSQANTWGCDIEELDPKQKSNLDLTEEDLALLPHNSYFGFHSYGGPGRTFQTEAGAVTYDGKRVTDKQDYTTTAGCVLTDVTIPESDFSTTTIDGKSVQYVTEAKLKKADPLGPGWFIRYSTLDEKTAAGSSILVGTVFWPTYVPPAGAAQACSSPLTGDSGRSWQADYLTGAPNTAESFKIPGGYIQSKTRQVSAPPPEPASVISLSKTGEVSYGMLVTDPGAAPQAETLKTKRDLTSEIYWLEVPRNVHMCRHVNKNSCD